jgi:hypothetical protein
MHRPRNIAVLIQLKKVSGQQFMEVRYSDLPSPAILLIYVLYGAESFLRSYPVCS